jgi:hypothetical protein
VTDLEVQARMVWAWAMARVDKVREEGSDRGELLPWVIITALLAAAAIVIVAIIVKKATDTANNTKTQ